MTVNEMADRMTPRERDLHLVDMIEDPDFDERSCHYNRLSMTFLYSIAKFLGAIKLVTDDQLDPWHKKPEKQPVDLKVFRERLMRWTSPKKAEG